MLAVVTGSTTAVATTATGAAATKVVVGGMGETRTAEAAISKIIVGANGAVTLAADDKLPRNRAPLN